MTANLRTTARLLLPLLLLSILIVATRSTGYAQRGAAPPAAAAGAPAACPGEPMSVQATGVYTQKPVPEIVINGQPGPGAIWQPGMRSFWHCHTGGQIMMVFEGVGRVQQRGQKARTLHKGETEYAGPGVEHWHGASPDASAHFFQTSIGAGPTLWMEEVGRADYMGNDIGINSRTEFLRTGVRAKTDQAAEAAQPRGR